MHFFYMNASEQQLVKLIGNVNSQNVCISEAEVSFEEIL